MFVTQTGILHILTAYSRVLLEKLTGFAANQEIPRILWNPKVQYRTHKRPPPAVAGILHIQIKIIFLGHLNLLENARSLFHIFFVDFLF